MALGVERVRDRLLRASAALEAAGIAYAIVGGNAVAAWVATIDVAAVRNTQDVDVLLRRSDLALAVTALAGAGFVHRHAAGIEMFLDGPDAKARDALYIIFAGDKVRPEYEAPAPDVSESVKVGDSPFHVVAGGPRADETDVFPKEGSSPPSRHARSWADPSGMHATSRAHIGTSPPATARYARGLNRAHRRFFRRTGIPTTTAAPG